jgi:signal transduction histidine kinase
LFSLLKRINSLILLKITTLVIIEIILIIGSFSVLAYFQSQQSSLGNSINIAGKNRFLTASLLLQTEKYLDGSTDTLQLKAAIDNLQSNIGALKQGRTISGVDLRPLSSDFLNMWQTINQNWNVYKAFVIQNVLVRDQDQKPVATTTTITKTSISPIPLTTTRTTKGITTIQAPKKVLESMASALISSSDKLVTALGQQTDKNTQNVLLLQILFAALIVGVLVLILYLVIRILRPIFVMTQATSEIGKGNLDVSVEGKGNDDLSRLALSFNSMVVSIRNHIAKERELTKELEARNEELKNKDQLKADFINMAAHELRGPIQPILGLAEVLRNRKTSQGGGSNSSNSISKEDLDCLDTIIRNAKRLLRLEQNILDMSRIESRTLNLDLERFDLIEKVHDVINDFQTELSKGGIQLQFTTSQPEPIFVIADKIRVYEVLSNLLTNAIKFTRDKKGNITVKTEKKDNKVFVTIRDTGPGIAPEIRPRLFSKYVTNSRGGTGVGLFIAKSIVEAHGGRIWAENNGEDKGATFTFSLPASE